MEGIYPLVTPDWLHSESNNDKIVILDATIPKVGGILPPDNIRGLRIPGAIFFDLKKTFIDLSNPLPNTMPSAEIFNAGCQKLGISEDSIVVTYDQHGVYSSPRAWWMFRSMGHEQVFVLNGGLPAWIDENFPTEEISHDIITPSEYSSDFQEEMICDKLFVDRIRTDDNFLILDARSSGRFRGSEPEPRKEIRGGHIPNSKSLPYSTIVKGGKMLPQEELIKIYNDINPFGKQLVFSCGSGITACVLALGAVAAGHNLGRVYDGSWSDWGQPSHFPVEVG